jgi:hypothetical protein
MGRVDSLVIGASNTRFDAMALVEYPSRRAFVEIVNDPRVREIGAPCGWTRRAVADRHHGGVALSAGAQLRRFAAGTELVAA